MSLYPDYLNEENWLKELRLNPESPAYSDCLFRWKPINHLLSENIGLQVTNNLPITSLTKLHRTLAQPVTIQNQTTMATLFLPYFTNSSSSFAVASNPGLTNIIAPHITLPTYGTSAAHSVLNFNGNALTSACVDQLLITLANSLVPGTAYWCNLGLGAPGNSPHTSASAAAVAALNLSSYHISLAVN